MWVPRWKQLRVVVLSLRQTDIGDESLTRLGFTAFPRLWMDHGYMGHHVVIQSWDKACGGEGQEWNFSLWLVDYHNYDETYCCLVKDFGSTWVSDRDLLIQVANEIAKYEEDRMSKSFPLCRQIDGMSFCMTCGELRSEEKLYCECHWTCPICTASRPLDDDGCVCGYFVDEEFGDLPFNPSLN